MLESIRRFFSRPAAPAAAGSSPPAPELTPPSASACVPTDVAEFALAFDTVFWSTASPDAVTPVKASLVYDDRDPHAVSLVFLGLPTLLARDLLVKAVLAPAGSRLGDVDLFVHVGDDAFTFELVAPHAARSVMVDVPHRAVPTFLEATSSAFSKALERTRAGYDEELRSLLS